MASPLKQLGYTVEAVRPHQWIKNFFIFAAPMFGRQLFVPAKFGVALAAFASFCLASGAVYLFNDLVDRKDDQAHPTKRQRPIASGRLTLGWALGAAYGLWIGWLIQTVVHDFLKYKRKKAAEALWRLTGQGKMPTKILMADLRKEIADMRSDFPSSDSPLARFCQEMKIDIDQPVSKKWRDP